METELAADETLGKQTLFAVPMTCDGCAKDVSGALYKLDGISKVEADFESKLVRVEGTGTCMPGPLSLLPGYFTDKLGIWHARQRERRHLRLVTNPCKFLNFSTSIGHSRSDRGHREGRHPERDGRIKQ